LYLDQPISNLSFLYTFEKNRFPLSPKSFAIAAFPSVSVDLISFPDIIAVDIRRYGVVGKNAFHYIRNKFDYCIPENQGYSNQYSYYNNDFDRSEAVFLGHKAF
jgi:hypothetical protein